MSKSIKSGLLAGTYCKLEKLNFISKKFRFLNFSIPPRPQFYRKEKFNFCVVNVVPGTRLPRFKFQIKFNF